jgi:FMN-dependent oxidoreductase (nitrilotriacetate monooxygenase family)
VAGALNVPRTPQGHPVLVQAGSSENGRNFAARYAEVVFTAHQKLGDAQEFYDDLKRRAAEHGRDPDQVKILPGIVTLVGSTEAEARELDAELNRLISPEYALPGLAELLGVDLADLRLDEELPRHLPDEQEIEGARSRRTLVVNLGRRERLTVRQIIARLGGGRGHLTFAGTPVQVADAIEAWYDGGAADGFNVMPPVLPSSLERFVDEVVPILRERGRFRTEYTGRTLREHYGLPRPANRNVAARPAPALRS